LKLTLSKNKIRNSNIKIELQMLIYTTILIYFYYSVDRNLEYYFYLKACLTQIFHSGS